MTKDNLKEFLDYYENVKKRLVKKNRRFNRSLTREKNPVIRMFFSDLADLNDGGKMLRGMLVTLGYALAGGQETEYPDDLALAFEIFQTGVLIHDDIIDRASVRRGKMTVERRYAARLHVRGTEMVAAGGNAAHIASSAALCTGDIGLYLSNLKIAESYEDHPALGKLIASFDEMILSTIRGELLDVVLPYELQDSSYSEKEKNELLEQSIRDIYHLKTSCYSLIGPLHLGMMLAGAGDKLLRAMDKAADDLGIAYQIMDDILGIYSDTIQLGKDVGSDISEFKQTILYMYIKVYAPEYEEELLRYYGREADEESLEEVRRIMKDSGALDYARDTMNSCFKRAETKLRKMKFPCESYRGVLLGFIDWCRGRRK